MGYYNLTRNGHLYSLIYHNCCKNALGVIKTRQEIDICVRKYTYDVVGIPWEVKQLDTQSAAVFTNLIKEESYPQFEVRAMLLGEKGTGKTTVARFLVGKGPTKVRISTEGIDLYTALAFIDRETDEWLNGKQGK